MRFVVEKDILSVVALEVFKVSRCLELLFHPLDGRTRVTVSLVDVHNRLFEVIQRNLGRCPNRGDNRGASARGAGAGGLQWRQA